MEHERYEAMVEEALTIKRRTRRDQARLMLLLKEAKDADVLSAFCGDINLSIPAATNYLVAYDKFVNEHGIVPGSGAGADDLVAEMWENVFDPTLDGRYGYGGVNREDIDAAANDLELRGSTKAYDIAKNPRSMMAAIIGDPRAASAAVEAVLARAKTDPLIATALRSAMHRGGSLHPKPREDQRDQSEVVMDMLSELDQVSIELSQVDVPEHMASSVAMHVGGVITRLHEVVTIMEGKEALADL